MKHSPKDIALSARNVTRRSLLLGTAQVAIIGVLGWRMRQMQVEEADTFRLMAEENRVDVRLIPPERGSIYDREGRPLAVNERNYQILMVRADAGDIETVFADLRRLIPITDDQLDQARRALRANSRFREVAILDNLTWNQVAEVSVNTPALPGISVGLGFSRNYPMGRDFAHIIGYVGPVSDYDLSRIEDQDPLLRIPRFRIGKSGVESELERDLRGAAGTRRVEVNAIGRVMRELERSESHRGDDLQLTVDAAMQNYTQQRLDVSGESVSAVVMDVTNGDIRAIASAPTFDPNLFVSGISVKNYKGLIENEFRPLRAKAVQDTYAPASTFKMIVALAALEAGEIEPNEPIKCAGKTQVFEQDFHCWKRSGHGNVRLLRSIAESCDVFYYELAQRVGIEKISAMATRFGLGIRPDIPLSAVQRGVAPTKEWKQKSFGKDWVVGDTVNASIGQGFVLTSPVQLAIMTARLATGRSVQPRMVLKRNGIETPSGAGDDMGLNPDNLALVQRAMSAVTNTRSGTGFRVRSIGKGLEMAGKTGTSQVRRITAAERRAGVIRNEDLPWGRRDHGLFVAYAPVENPKFAVSVIVEHGGSGGRSAAPIARDLLLRALTDSRPPVSAYPSASRRDFIDVHSQMELRDFDAAAEDGDQV